MIRPFTIATFLLACGSGLYLYQSKHEVQVLDRTIDRTAREIAVLREQSRLLSAEWTMLNDPERLRQFSDTYLTIRPILPPQFSSLADLDSRLPPARQPAAAAPPDDQGPIPIAAEPAPPVNVGSDEILPIPPPPTVQAPRPVERKIVSLRPAQDPAPPRAGDVHPADRTPRPPDTRVSETRPAELHPAAAAATQNAVPPPVRIAAAPPARLPPSAQPSPGQPSPGQPSPGQPSPAPAAYTGSLLGMARGVTPVPVPRPTPATPTNWYAN